MKFLKRIRNKWHSDLIAMERTQLNAMENIYSYIENKTIMMQSASIREMKDFDYFEKIHNSLRVFDLLDRSYSLVRVGNTNDGGYIMLNFFSRKNIAYSFGISDDVSWDKAMAEYGYEIYQYDPTIKRLPEQNVHFHWNRMGVGNTDSGYFRTIKTLMRDNQHDFSGMILKMDVEGAEWDSLDNIDICDLTRFDQMVIEMHDILKYPDREKIIRVLNKLAQHFWIIHIHPNNYDKVRFFGNTIFANTIETTWVNKEQFEARQSSKAFPILIDSPCNPKISEISLGFWNESIIEE